MFGDFYWDDGVMVILNKDALDKYCSNHAPFKTKIDNGLIKLRFQTN